MSKRKPVSQEFVDDSDDPEDTGVNVRAKYTRNMHVNCQSRIMEVLRLQLVMFTPYRTV